MTAEEVKAALRRRHPAAMQGSMVGQWVCLEEWDNIDLIALNAWRGADVIGYEVKVSRSDYRRELLAPAKRTKAVEMCTEFYFAVPAGLLTAEELAYREPGDLRPGDFEREECPGFAMGGPVREHRHRALFGEEQPPRPIYGGRCHKRRREERKHHVTVPIPAVLPEPALRTMYGDRYSQPDDIAVREVHGVTRIVCPTCDGRGYVAKSRVEEEAPTLWVPSDVGLIEVGPRGARSARKSPRRRDAPGLVAGGSRYQIAQLVRWASNRPDPRHLPVAPGEAVAA